jgi:hypothetical protein
VWKNYLIKLIHNKMNNAINGFAKIRLMGRFLIIFTIPALLFLAGFFIFAVTASADSPVDDNFDSYPIGLLLPPAGSNNGNWGWTAWCNVMSSYVSNDQYYSPPNFLNYT